MDRQTLLDLARRSGSNATLRIVEGLAQENALFKRMPFRGIVGDSEKYLRRVSLPTVYWKGYNQGISPSKSEIVPIRIETKMLGGRSIVDKKIAERAIEGIKKYRAKEDISFLAAMSNKFNYSMFYSDSKLVATEPDGIATILNSLSKETVVNAGANSGAVTSIYAVSFKDALTSQGRRPAVEGLLANGSLPKGFDMGLQYISDKDGLDYLAYITEFEFDPGIAIYEDLAVGRICNIDADNKPTAQDFLDVITKMVPFKPSVIFANKTGWSYIQSLAISQNVTYINPVTNLLDEVLTIYGIPVEIDSNISDAEAVVS
jgi:hypothetical protein